MNPLFYEVELFGLAVLLYLYDSSVLLCANEAILTRTASDRWSASWGWPGFLFAGRTLCVLNPFAPHQASFRLGWNFNRIDVDGVDESWPACTEQLKRIAAAVWVAGIALFVVLPLGMFSALGDDAVIAAVALLYGSTLFALFRLYRERGLLTRSGKRFWSFAFECLACPPFAVNMLRRISLSLEVGESLPLAAARLLGPEQWATLREECLSRLEAVMRSAEEGSREYLALAAQKEWLRAYVPRP